jgi:hypothetical protein
MVLVTAGCGLLSDHSTSTPNANSSATPQTQKKIDFASAERNVRNAISKLKSAGRTVDSTIIKPVKGEINSAIDKLGQDENEIAERCADCSEETKRGAFEVVQLLSGISNSLKDSPKIEDLSPDVKNQLQQDLNDGAERLNKLSLALTTTPGLTPAATQTPITSEMGKDEFDWWRILMLSLKVIGVLLVVVLLASALNYLWNRAWKTVELNISKVLKAHLAAAREAQPDYAAKLASLSSAQAEMSSKFTELNTEVRSLARIVRESVVTRRSDGNSAYSGLNYQSHVEDGSSKDEPEFPVSAVEYLGKMNRYANVVRPDFQNGILVNDSDGDGELVLIRDSRNETQPLFVVPRATQFQTKQDFYTYYQKYYDCVRPMAGDVWIIGPAVVEKVAGGWQLREKGMLEIR